MSEVGSPRQVVEALMKGISDEDWPNLHRLFSDDALIQYPFALPERRQLQGLEAIKMYFAATSALPLKLRMQNLIIHQTANSEVVVAEWDYDVVVTTTGHTCNVSNITVTTVRNGKIVVSRDYHNHAILARALGR